ncbi:MAG: hypothetical protein RIR06_592, partial [Bacteroidota bacterium]
IQSWAQGKVLPFRKDFFYGIPRKEGIKTKTWGLRINLR